MNARFEVLLAQIRADQLLDHTITIEDNHLQQQIYEDRLDLYQNPEDVSTYRGDISKNRSRIQLNRENITLKNENIRDD